MKRSAKAWRPGAGRKTLAWVLGAWIACWISLAISTLTVFAATPPADLDAQAMAIARELMCPVCEGQTVADSNSTLAAQMRQIIREQLRQGKTRQEILDYFVSQFGESVLATPPKRGMTLVLWVAPYGVLLLGLALAGLVMWRWTRSRPAPAAAPSAPVDPAQLQRLRDELEREE